MCMFRWGGYEAIDWIPSHVRRGLDEEKILYLSVPVIYLFVLIRRYQCFLAMIKVSNMMESGVPKYWL